MSTKQLTKSQKTTLKKWNTAFTEDEVLDGFEIEVGFFGSFPFLIKNDNGEFEAIQTGSGETVNELGKSVKMIPLYSFTSTKLANGVVEGLNIDDWDKFTEQQQESAAVTYGSLKEGSELYSLGTFAANEDFEKIIKSRELGKILKKRFYICGLIPDLFGMKPIMFTFGITASKTWSSYVNLLRSQKMTPIACVCKITLEKEKHKTKKKITFHRPVFEVVTKNSLPVFSQESPQQVRDVLFPIRDEIKARHILLVQSMESVVGEPTE